MEQSGSRHTFAVCAYKESPYLEDCLKSLSRQTIPAKVIICTSTPCGYIDRLAEKYQVPVYVRDGQSDIQADWNFAWETADTPLVTIAHQDDMYHKEYAERMLKTWETYPDTTVAMTDAVIIKNGKLQAPGKVMWIKKLLRLPLVFPGLNHFTAVKRMALVFGNPIMCPSCTYSKERLRTPLFQSEFKFALDWDTMWDLAAFPGRFICLEWPLLYYRVHEGATTKACIQDNRREQEEIRMYSKIWPKPVVKLLMHFYKKAYSEYAG